MLVPFTSHEDHDFFQHLEMHMRAENPPICGRDHLSYRSYYYPVKNIIDGDLCEQFNTLDASKQKSISEELDRLPADVSKKLEDIRTRYAFWTTNHHNKTPFISIELPDYISWSLSEGITYLHPLSKLLRPLLDFSCVSWLAHRGSIDYSPFYYNTTWCHFAAASEKKRGGKHICVSRGECVWYLPK